MNKAELPTPRPRATWLRMLPGLLVTILAVGALVLFVDLGEVQQAFSRVDIVPALPLVVLLFIGTVSARAMAWRTTLEEKASFRDCFMVLNQGYLLNNVLPLRLGELGRAILLSGRIGANFWRVLPSVIIERILDLGFAAGLLLATLPFVVGAEWASSAGLVAVGLVAAGFVLLFVMANRPAWALVVAKRLTQPWPKLQAWLVEQLSHILDGLAPLRSLSRFLRIVFWMTLTWFFNVAWYYALMLVFMPQAVWLWAFFSIAASAMGVAVPSSPGYIGVMEAVMVISLAPFGVDAAVALAYAVAAHVIYFVITAVIGVIGFWQQGQSLGSIYNQLLSRSTSK
jgi:uncharacterized protein (TIRG00374 family)